MKFFDRLHSKKNLYKRIENDSSLIVEQYEEIELLKNKVRDLEEENSKLKKLVENGQSAIDTNKRLCNIILELEEKHYNYERKFEILIDFLTEYWHNHETNMTLREFLNMSEDEYEKWIKGEKWEVEMNENTGYMNLYTCPHCGFRKFTDTHVSLGYKYCPNCGIKMAGSVYKDVNNMEVNYD